MFKKLLATALLGAFTSSTAFALSNDQQILQGGFDYAFDNVQSKLSDLWKKEVTIVDRDDVKQKLVTNIGALALFPPQLKFDGRRASCSELALTVPLTTLLYADVNENLQKLSGSTTRAVAVTEMTLLEVIKRAVAVQFELGGCKVTNADFIEYFSSNEALLKEWDKKLPYAGFIKTLEELKKSKPSK